jgi:chemotaxis protein methyltransferase CheR
MLQDTSLKRVLSDNEFYQIRDYIYEISGIYFKLEKKYLIEDKIVARLSELLIKNISDYIYYLKFNSKKNEELKILYDYITINETSFFRNSPILEAWANEIMATIFKNSSNGFSKSVRIWSAGCSSGEEPYTLSIMLHDMLKDDMGKWFIEILATDINHTVLEKAKLGIYTDYALRTTEPVVKQKCFDKIDENQFRIKDTYRKIIKFQNLNLMEAVKSSALPKFDVIFCRNVLIYFDNDSKKKVISKYYDLLKPEGYLILGHSESLHGISGAFKLTLFKSAIAYKKE